MLYKLKIYAPLILILGVVGYYLLKFLLFFFVVGYQVHEPRQLEKQEYLYSLNAGVEFQDSLFTIIVLDYLPKNKADSLCYLEARHFFMTDTSFNKRDYCLYFFNDTKEIYYIEREASKGIYLTAYYSCNKKYISIFELEEREKIRIANKFDNEIVNSYLIKKYPYLEAK
jgi:hypothetical protein